MIIFEHTVPAAAIWIGLLGAATVALLSFWRHLPAGVLSLALAALRLLFFALLGWCLFLPQRKETETQVLKPRFIVALDASQSMGLSPAPDISNRWFHAQEILARPWAAAVAAECEVDLYAFSAEIGARRELATAAELLPDGPSTLLRDSLRRLAQRYKGQNVTAFLLLSDGLDTREASDDWAGEPWPWPIYTVRLEPPAAWEQEADLRVDAVNTDRRVNVGWKSPLTAVISGQGTRGQAFSVQLFENDALLQEMPTQIPAQGGSKEIAFQLDHPQIGFFTYRVAVPALPGESHTNDNSYAVTVQVVDTRNRVLYVEGPPRYESKFMTRALNANRQITPLVFVRGPEGKFITLGPRGNVTPDMTPADLAHFKIVILGNLDAGELGETRAANLLRFVEDGGSLILLGGTKGWGDDGFLKTPLKPLVPVKAHRGTPLEGSFPGMLTDAGRSHPAFAGDEVTWAGMPPVLSVFPDAVLAAGAEALVGAGTDTGLEPILVTHRYGQGKVVAVLTDSLWRWKLNPDTNQSRLYQRFWDQMISWLTPTEEEVSPRQLDIFADQDQLFLGDEIRLSARLSTGDDTLPEGVAVTCEIVTPDKRTMPFSMTRQHVVTSTGRSFPGFAAPFKAETPGLHAATAVARIEGKTVTSDPISFYVKPFTPESVSRPANQAVLEAIARSSAARYFDTAAELDEGLAGLEFTGREEENVTYHSLWQRWLILSCLLAMLSLEWGVRKWRNMP